MTNSIGPGVAAAIFFGTPYVVEAVATTSFAYGFAAKPITSNTHIALLDKSLEAAAVVSLLALVVAVATERWSRGKGSGALALLPLIVSPLVHLPISITVSWLALSVIKMNMS